MLIPPINSKGVFDFEPPFDVKVEEGLELTVIAVRTLQELVSSNTDPYDIIYRINELSEEDYEDDLKNDIPIVVFLNESGDYLYIPGDRIKTIPQIAGVKYVEKTIAISLGPVPLDMELELTLESLKEIVYDTLGIKPSIKVLDTSAVTLLDQTKHDEYMKLIKNRKTIDKSYKTMYVELSREYNDQLSIMRRLEERAVQLGIGKEKVTPNSPIPAVDYPNSDTEK